MNKAIGIDLGTTNSVAAFKDISVKILRNKETEELTRSCVALRNDEIIVGKHGFEVLKTQPHNTILSIKRLMGGAIKDTMVQEMLQKRDYYRYGITTLAGGTQESVAVVMGGKQYTPEQISAEIIKKLKADSEEKLGSEVSHAVITVPAYFTEKQKNATKIAAKLAGLKVQKLLAEPTAAAIAYGAGNLIAGDAKTILIYDFGGGTFDLSILNIVDGQYIEAGTSGDSWLGGDDIDIELIRLVKSKIEKQYEIKDLDALITRLNDKKRFQFEYYLREGTERAKIELSSINNTSVSIDNIIEDENDDIIDVDVNITRSELEHIVYPFVTRSMDLIDKLLRETSYDISMIDNILLVGGTSCIPLVKKMLAEKYGIDIVKVTEKPMLAVAEGAAILAHRLDDSYEPSEDNQGAVTDISYSTNHNYYIELKDGKKELIINKQIPLPIGVSPIFKTSVNNQKIVKVALFSDEEDGQVRSIPETTGFFTIDEDLPIDSEIVFDIQIGIDETFSIQVHPKSNKTKRKNLVLGRGHKDSKTLEFISQTIEQVTLGEYTERQREIFSNSVQKEIEKANLLGSDNSDSEKWSEIGTNIFLAKEEAERKVDPDTDEDKLTIFFAKVLIYEYPDLIGTNVNAIESFIQQSESEDDPLLKIQATMKLKETVEQYPVLIKLFFIKMTSDNITKTNPAEAHKLLKMHDDIHNHFRNRRNNEAYNLLEEALEISSKYDRKDFDITSIHLKK